MVHVRAKHVVWSIAFLSIVVMLIGVSLTGTYILRTGNSQKLLSHQAMVPFLTVAYALVGGMIASRQPRNPVGWVFIAVGFLNALIALGVGGETFAALTGVNEAGWKNFTVWFNRWSWIPGIYLPTVFVFLYFPDGRLPGPRWRPVAWAGGLGLAGIVLGGMLYPGEVQSWGIEGANPYGIRGLAGVLDVGLDVGSALSGIAFFGSVAALVVKFRRSRDVRREQMKWLVYASGWMIVTFVIGSLMWMFLGDVPAVEEWSIVLTSLAILGVAVGASIAILRHRLYDIDLVINRTLVYGALTVSVVVAYVLLVGYLGQLFQLRGGLGISMFATGVVAVMAHPLRERLQLGVNRLMYGERDDPYRVLSSLGQRLEATIAPNEVLPTIVESVAQALKLPYTAIELQDGEQSRIAVEYGRPVEATFSVPLTYQGEQVGRLLCAARSPGEEFNSDERRLLEDVAHHAGLAVHAVQLTSDLQRSRERLVKTREEERRRLRRDLHDGLGPELAGMMLKLDAAQNLVGTDPERALELLADLKGRVQEALSDIRRLVYNLRPPALDELGLISAVRQRVGGQESPDGLSVRVIGPETAPSLPAAVEVAAYRIALEAVTNVAHHARATRCEVHFTVEENLEVEVIDDGRGFPDNITPGVGLASMKERVAELGGELELTSRPQGGAKVVARLPLGTEGL